MGIKSGCVMTKSKVPQEEVWSEYKGTDESKNVQIAFLGFLSSKEPFSSAPVELFMGYTIDTAIKIRENRLLEDK